ncbi:CDK-activating kinase assembly factor mat1 [Alternaria arbusti]|uniref:CDK-activating kinase assembly factor mat1 n=1 Tax=Alternaria arbusti TaxID=232088 RepID=UPI00221EB1B1|nr:CDK-activating kinase assembly factor mat1 [Alternaria arbusti]KAI4945249.1 CDK-activating kinase assembly factor mat1 [Alternaria arbusti]
MSSNDFVARLMRNPAEAEIDRFLQTRSGKQMIQLFRLIPDPKAQAALTARLLLLGPPVNDARFTTPEKAKKALNAFVAFRCYYVTASELKKWPMKKLSSIIGALWEADMYKSYWSLMAKAWSTIRDQVGKVEAPLDRFLIIICGHLHIPEPESYLAFYGWSLSINKEGNPFISRDGSLEFACIGAGVADIALSVEDIIAYVQSMGYASTYVAIEGTSSSTFLGRSVNSTVEKGGLALRATPIVAPVIDRRIVARNKRRAKRDIARTSALRINIEQDILAAHRAVPGHTGEHVPDRYPTPALPNYDINPFYQQLVGYLDSPITDSQDDANPQADATLIDNAFVSDTIAYGNITNFASSMVLYPDNFDAFRPGANEDTTLPAFDDVLNT